MDQASLITASEREENIVSRDADPQDHATSIANAKRATLDAESSVFPDRTVYLDCARGLLRVWLWLIGPEPWFRSTDPRNAQFPNRQAIRQAATLAIALLREHDRTRPDDGYLREIIRVSLIHWQQSLTGNGRPKNRTARMHPSQVLAASYVVRLLSETSDFGHSMILDDLRRHIPWLATRPRGTPLTEARMLSMLAEAGVLLRDRSLIDMAKNRVELLLGQQDDEGWFPGRSGPNLNHLGLLVDALGGLYQQTGWSQLEEPLRRATHFLIQFVQPDGRLGTCGPARRAAYLYPFGVETLAATNPEAAALARVCRLQCISPHVTPLWAINGKLAAIMGASVSLAASTMSKKWNRIASYPHESEGRTRFPHAGVTILSTPIYHAIVGEKSGGALRVVWHRDRSVLHDSGVSVQGGRDLRQSGFQPVHVEENENDKTITTTSAIRRVRSSSAANFHDPTILRSLRCWMIASWKSLRAGLRWFDGREHGSKKRVFRGDRHVRKLTFGSESIRIEDQIHTALPTETIVCQASPPDGFSPYDHATTEVPSALPPVFVAGGRHVAITRVYRHGRLAEDIQVLRGRRQMRGEPSARDS